MFLANHDPNDGICGLCCYSLEYSQPSHYHRLPKLRHFSSTNFSISLPIFRDLHQMYTVGPDYGHAEARKSPAVDGKVERNIDGKEVRFPVILTLREKEIARR
jgi:hypothetical protein